jgi:glutamate dehydrogenase/leucine dehydrogenase
VRSIVAGANHPFAAESPGDTSTEQYADQLFAVVPDIIASCGTAHAFACQSQSDTPLPPSAVFESIRTTVTEAVDETVRRAAGAEFGLLAAGLAMALERCESSTFNSQPIGDRP